MRETTADLARKRKSHSGWDIERERKMILKIMK